MSLPATFSQSSLQDFETCARRFKLRYLDNLRWPAVEAEPVEEAERLADLGRDFHRLVHQHLIGLDADLLTAGLTRAESELQQWWQHYLARCPAQLDQAELYPELTLSAPLRGHRLLARFDVLARQANGRFLIIDWKTSQKKPPRPYLEQRIQTRVYPYVLSMAGVAYNHGQPIDPAAITMLYWYPQFPEEPEEFAYSQTQQKADEQFLAGLVKRIKHETEFPRVENTKPCIYCVYRSLCERGGAIAAELPAWEAAEPESLSLDWDQIAEIQF